MIKGENFGGPSITYPCGFPRTRRVSIAREGNHGKTIAVTMRLVGVCDTEEEKARMTVVVTNGTRLFHWLRRGDRWGVYTS